MVRIPLASPLPANFPFCVPASFSAQASTVTAVNLRGLLKRHVDAKDFKTGAVRGEEAEGSSGSDEDEGVREGAFEAKRPSCV